MIDAEAQTPTATSKLIGPFPTYRGFTNGLKIPFLEVLSADAKQTVAGTGFIGKKYPVIIALHGIGERTVSYGSIGAVSTGDLNRLYTTSLPSLVRYTNSILYNKRFAAPGRTDSTSFCYIFPQCYEGYPWFYPGYGKYILDYIYENQDIYDTSRIYLAGLSFGGGGVAIFLQDPEIRSKIAAAIANCLGYHFVSGLARDYKGVADWGGFLMLCHSTSDSATIKNPITREGSYLSDQFSDSIMKYKGITILQYKRYTNRTHNGTWDPAYNPNNANTNFPMSNGQNTNFMLNFHSQFLMFSTKGRRKVVP